MESCMFVEVNDSATLFFNFEELKTYLIITFANYISFIYIFRFLMLKVNRKPLFSKLNVSFFCEKDIMN